MQAAVRSLSLGAAQPPNPLHVPQHQQQEAPSAPRAMAIATYEEVQPAIRLSLNVIAPEPPLLPVGVTAELWRQRAEAAALEEAELELKGLEEHKRKLQAQVGDLIQVWGLLST